MHAANDMPPVTRIPRPSTERSRGLSEVESLAWLLDNSIPVPGTGRRFGIDALIGFVPVVGDLVSGGIGLFVVWRASRLGVPGVVVGRMLVNTLIDLAVGAIPFAGDAFDLWFKANSRNLGLLRRHFEQPDRSLRTDWLVLLTVVALAALIIGTFGWLLGSLLTTVVGAA